jgi:UDP-GlcNAc:undecaprenyl-phosphate GlcNAc-1-phosphate transferase
MGAVATVVWVVFLMNSLNFLDNMDGLTGGISMIVSVAFALVAFSAGKWFMAAIFVTLAGSLAGFLIHNFHPAKLFMGDNGSLFLGYIIAALSIQCNYSDPNAPTILPMLTPLIVLGVPIFDTVSVLWIRWRAGKPLMQGDKNHFSHRLLDLGMSQRRAALLIYFLTAAVALGAIPLRTASLPGGCAILLQTALVFLAIYHIERAAQRKIKE